MTRLMLVSALCGMLVGSSAQAWVKPYESALRSAKQVSWTEARAQFKEAITARAADTDKSSQVGGAVADRKPWRKGAPYSPNFGAAYASFKLASEATDVKARNERLTEAISEFTALLAKGQESVESMLFLAASHAANNDMKKANELQERIGALDPAKAFKIDREMIDQTDLATLAQATTPVGTTGATNPQVSGLPQVGIGSRTGLIPVLDFKYALLIGESGNGGPAWAGDDLEILKTALTKHAGYADDHIVVVKNATNDAIMQAARDLAERLPDSGTVFLFYTGRGYHDVRNGKDYLAAANTPEVPDVDKMVPKLALIEPFVMKGATIFTFFQVDRPIDKQGKYFGMEVPQTGRIAQCQSNSPGERAHGGIAEGKMHGVYAYAMTQVLADMRGNRIAVSDFIWNTFYKVRRGSADGSGGGAQTPTLPVVVSMTTSARF